MQNQSVIHSVLEIQSMKHHIILPYEQLQVLIVVFPSSDLTTESFTPKFQY